MTDAQSVSTPEGFSELERAAIKERAAELREAGRPGRGSGKAADERKLLAKIAEMPQPDRGFAERIHVIVTTVAPELTPKLWYGAPSYYKDGKVVCFFRSGQGDNERYSTFGFGEKANLDDGAMWPTAYAVTELTEADEAKISALVKKAVADDAA